MDADDAVSGTRVPVPRGDRAVLLSVCMGSYFAVRFAQVLIGSVVPLIIGTFTVSRGAVGLALTGMWVAYALVQLPSGVLADRTGERRVIVAALATAAGTTLVLAAAPTFPVFVGAVVALGLGAGAYYNPATALLARNFDELGGPIGTHRVGGQLAGVVAPLVAAAVTVRSGWRLTVAVGTLLAVAAASLFLRVRSASTPIRPDASLPELFDPGSLVPLLAHPHVRTTTFVMILVEFVGLATMAFLPTVLVEQFGFSIGRANLLFAVFFAVSALCQPIGGRLSDRIGRDSTIAVQMVAGILGYAALATGRVQLLALPAVVFAGVAASSTPVIQSRMIDGLAASNRGAGFGLFRTLYLLVGASGTTVVGVTADAAGWTVGFGLLSSLLLVALVSIGLRGTHASPDDTR